MDQLVQSFNVDLEDGELSQSDDDGYTPLERPTSIPESNGIRTTTQMNVAVEDEDSQSEFGQSSDSTSADSDSCLKKLTNVGTKSRKKQKTKRSIMVREKQYSGDPVKKRTFKKYDIWTTSLQEDDLTENMRGIDVTKSRGYDRNVEYYDYNQKFRYMEENSLKRRLSISMEDQSSNDSYHKKKRGRTGESVKSRLGQRCQSSASNTSDISNEPRNILDLEDPLGRDGNDIAQEISNKLYEEKDELLKRVVQVCGVELPIEIYKETQRIEADGGMMIKTGQRRRTPGGVFLFLLKNHERITPDQQKLIFMEERKNTDKWKKEKQALSRHRKVEELKKRLSAREKDFSVLTTKKNHFLGSELKNENKIASLSNPPPSPVGQDQSPEYKTHAINHILNDEVGTEKPCTSTESLTSKPEPMDKIANETASYEDDSIDLHCGEMDLF